MKGSHLAENLASLRRSRGLSQEKVAELAMPQIKEITKGKSFSPAELERSRNWFTNELLRVFNRRIGDRNDAA